MPLFASEIPVDGVPARWGAPSPMGLTYTDPDGDVWWWSDLAQPVILTGPPSGLGSPPVSVGSIDLPGGGSLAQTYQPSTKTLIIGLLAEHADQSEFLKIIDKLGRALWTVRDGRPAPGMITVYRPGGVERRISVLCTGGAEGIDDNRDKSGLTWMAYALTFTASDPYWQDTSPQGWGFEGSPIGGGVPAMPPVLLTGATVLGDTSVSNSGDVEAYPIWTIHGPGKPTFINFRSGRQFGLNVTLGVDEIITVDTRPTMQAATDATGANRWGDLVKSSPRDLWPLLPGNNDLHLGIAASGPGTAVHLSYTRRWLRA